MDKAERTKQYIVEKASPIFNKKGYQGTSLSNLTDATKLTKGSIYGNFENKDDIAATCFSHNAEKITREIRSELAGIQNPVNQLYVFPRVYRRIYQSVIENGGCPIANTLIEADDTHPQLNEMALNVIHGLESTIVTLIDEGKSSGYIKETIESLKTAQLMITLFEGGIILSKATGEDGFMTGAIEQVESIIDLIRN